MRGKGKGRTLDQSGSVTPRAGILTWIATLVLLQGCATVTVTTIDGSKKTMTIDAFRQYAEAVFKRQNRASDRMILLADELDPYAYQPLADAERKMLEACAPLNAIAARERDQEPVGLALKRRVAANIDACDRATGHLEKLLEPFDE